MEPTMAMRHSLPLQSEIMKARMQWCSAPSMGFRRMGDTFVTFFDLMIKKKWQHIVKYYKSVRNAAFKSLMECLTGAQGFTFDWFKYLLQLKILSLDTLGALKNKGKQLSVKVAQTRAANVRFCQISINFSSVVYSTKFNEHSPTWLLNWKDPPDQNELLFPSVWYFCS